MVKLAMLGSGFIARFYADSILGQRSKDKIVSIYSRKEENARSFAEQYEVKHITTVMEEAIANPEVDMVCISLPNNLHEEAVMLCCKHKKAVLPPSRSDAMLLKHAVCWKQLKPRGFLTDILKIWSILQNF